MKIRVFDSKPELGSAAAADAALVIAEAASARGQANIILATGASQFETLAALAAAPEVEWSRVTMFHLDEYIGMPKTHPASFRKYLTERFVEKVTALKAIHLIEGDAADPAAECARVGEIILRHPVDVALVGIGENGHLAFNDPPADLETTEPFIVVDLDVACRRQQLGEGWFATLDDVPERAISMSVQQIMKSATVICSAPDERKADAVKAAIEGPVVDTCPASILQRHADCRMYLDRDSASKLVSPSAD